VIRVPAGAQDLKFKDPLVQGPPKVGSVYRRDLSPCGCTSKYKGLRRFAKNPFLLVVTIQ
jgi:hypothetical protein